MDKPATAIHAYSFGSEGQPNDDGLPLGGAILEAWGKMLLGGGVTTFHAMTPRRLRDELGEGWSVRRYCDEHQMHANPGYHTVGLGAWRVVILRMALEAAQDGDIVLIHCCNYIKYPEMISFAANARAYAEAAITLTDFYMPPHTRTSHFTAGEVLHSLLDDSSTRELVAHAPMGRGRLIIARANERTRRFARMVEDLIRADPIGLLSPKGKTGFVGGLHYFHPTAEQSVLSVLAYREGFFPLPWEGTWIERLMHAGSQDGNGYRELIGLIAEELVDADIGQTNLGAR